MTVSRSLVLKQAVATLGLTVDQATTYEEGTDNLLGWIKIHVPAHINMPRLETGDFCGDYCPSVEEAIESASLAALFYMQKHNLIVIDDINLFQLRKCKKALIRAKIMVRYF